MSLEIEQPTVLTEVPEGQIAPVIETPPAPIEIPEQSYIYQPTDENGRSIGGKQVLKYRTNDELIAKLQEQNVLLVRKLRSETKKNRLGIQDTDEIPDEAPRFETPVNFAPRQLTPDQRFQLSRDLLDPERFEEATDTLFESKIGVNPKILGQKLESLQTDNTNMKARIEADAFVAANSDYVICEENFKAVTNWMLRYDLAPVRSNFQKAFDTLKAAGILLIEEERQVPIEVTLPPPPPPPLAPVPQDEVPPAPPALAPEPETPRFAPARIPTGLTREQSAETGASRAPGDDIVYEVVVGGQKRTFHGLAAVNAMPSDVFKHRVNHEKGFSQKVNKLEEDATKNKNRGRQ